MGITLKMKFTQVNDPYHSQFLTQLNIICKKEALQDRKSFLIFQAMFPSLLFNIPGETIKIPM